VTIVVPHGKGVEKNAAMRAFGAELIEHGSDFQDALEHASKVAGERDLTMVPSFHETLVRGVATYGLELLRAVDGIDTLYVPIGLGSGIVGTIAAREALGLTTKIVGVASANAPAYALSFAARKPVSTESAITLADGLAVRVPDAGAVEIINRFAERVVIVSDQEVEDAIRHYFTDTHNVAEGAGAAALAALLKERDQMRGRRVGLVLSGGNVDLKTYARMFGGQADVP
jgi:threonine dehydratase